LVKITKNYNPFKNLTCVSLGDTYFNVVALPIKTYIHPMDLFVKWLMIALSSSVKFVAGPLLGKVYDLPWWETAFFTFVGMMVTVILFSTVARSFFHKYLKGLFNRNEKRITPGKRRVVRIWNKFGISGVAFLTPILLTPIGGSIVAASFGEHPVKIISYMAVSAAFWAVTISLVLYFIPLNFH
jgi:hypothetical protein